MRCLPDSVQVSEDPYVEIQVHAATGLRSVVPLYAVALWQECPGEPSISGAVLSPHPMLHPEAGMLAAMLESWDPGQQPSEPDLYLKMMTQFLHYEGRSLSAANLGKPLKGTAITVHAARVERGLGRRGRQMVMDAWKADIMQMLNPGYVIRTVGELYDQQEKLLRGESVDSWVEKL